MQGYLEYAVEAVSDDVIDWRLQIVRIDGKECGVTRKPQWFRERQLTEDDEIVDALLDAKTGQVKWMTHRPTRGWYLHIRSPNMPRDMAIPLQSVRGTRAGSTPLSLCIGTRLDTSTLHKLNEHIAESNPTSEKLPDTSAHKDDQFTIISLDTHNGFPTHSSPAKREASTTHARASSMNLEKSHARRRSAGFRISESTSRHPSKSFETAMVGEVEEQEEDENGRHSEASSTKEGNVSNQNITSEPQSCHFTLNDVVQERNPQAKVNWAKWAWGNIPEPIRAPMTLDISKTFSIVWLDAPQQQHKGGIEVLRFEDDTKWWNWKGKRRGKIVVQQEAVKALRLDLGFWITVSTMSCMEGLVERG
jgi:hypothetical protein